jgi:hypothetical protein
MRGPPKAQTREVPIQKEVRYVQHIVLPEEITTDTEKLGAIWEWLTPKNKHEWAYVLITDGLYLALPTL